MQLARPLTSAIPDPRLPSQALSQKAIPLLCDLYSFRVPLRVESLVHLNGWLHTKTVSAIWAQQRVTYLMQAMLLPMNHHHYSSILVVIFK